MQKRPSRVFFPWERRKSWLGGQGRARVRRGIWLILVLICFLGIREHEEKRAAVRATRAAIRTAFEGVFAYRADHRGACPKDVRELVLAKYTVEVPTDAWGRPLRVVCPGRRDPSGFDVLSDGPDGLPFGLDRVE